MEGSARFGGIFNARSADLRPPPLPPPDVVWAEWETKFKLPRALFFIE
jgi:hypothetical protein